MKGFLIVLILLLQNVQGDTSFVAPTDDMIERFSKENPQAASDYEEVMAELMATYEAAAKDSSKKKVSRVYEAQPIDREMMEELNIMLEQDRSRYDDMMAKESTEEEVKKETASEMEARIRREIKTEMDLEREIREKIKKEMMNSAENNMCVPGTTVCGFNIVVYGTWILLIAFVVYTCNTNNKKTKVKRKQT